VHTSIAALEADIRAWIDTWNESPRPFAWTKTADEILNSLAKYLARISGTALDSVRGQEGINRLCRRQACTGSSDSDRQCPRGEAAPQSFGQ
jgi:hypothetical protein